MIKSVKLQLGKKEVELTLEEVKKLRDDLDVILGPSPVFWPTVVKEIQYVPYYQPTYQPPYHIGDPPWGMGTICSTGCYPSQGYNEWALTQST